MLSSYKRKLQLGFLLSVSAFDPDSFGNTEYTEKNDTTYPIIPEGEYRATIKDRKFRVIEKTGSVVMDVTWIIDDEAVRTHTGLKEPTVRQGLFLDLVEGTDRLDFSEGKNVKLGRLREAVGLNRPGEPFSFNMLIGRAALIKTKNRKDGEDTYTDVKDIAPLA